jgi:hypothetical protein
MAAAWAARAAPHHATQDEADYIKVISSLQYSKANLPLIIICAYVSLNSLDWLGAGKGKSA